MFGIEKVIEQSDIGFAKHTVIYDETGKPADYCFISVNQAFEMLTGLMREELLNRRVSEIMPKITDDTFDWIGNYGQVVNEGKKCVFEQYFTPRDKWYRVEVISCEKDSLTTLFTDITRERKLMEASIRENEFLTNTNHGLRTPLIGIMGFSDILRTTSLDDEQREYVEIIYSSGKYLADIIANILDFYKIEVGKFEMNPQKTDLKQLIENTLTVFRPDAEKKGLCISFSVEGNVPQFIEVDGTRLRQTLSNLVSNAVKFTDKGIITVSVTLLERQTDQARLLFRVIDSGIGIRKEDQEKIFEPFRQGVLSSDKKEQGTGLGLTISKKMLEMMGGSLELNSVYGKGSTFSFELLLPFEGEQVIVTEEVSFELADKTVDFTNKKVLIAEDNPINMHFARTAVNMLSKDIHVIKAKDGEEAFRLYQEHQPDLILMDILMPGINGYQATAMIREINEKVPIIAMTAKAMEKDKEKGLAAGMNEYITKPVSLKRLNETLIKHL